MEFTIALREREAERAEALQAKLQLQDISLYRCEVDGAGPPLRTVEPVRVDAELESELERSDSAGVDYGVTLRVACDEPLAFHVRVTFLVRYRYGTAPQRTAKSELEAFRKSHAVLAAWPYVREFVHSTAAKMGFSVEPLPVLRVVLQGSEKKRS